MEITRYLSQKPRTPYAPSWDFAIAKDNLPIDVEKLSATCLEKEEEVLKLPISTFKTESGEDAIFDGYTGLGANCTTAKSWLYNVFNWNTPCLLYTSDAADDELGVDLGGRRIIK